MAEFPALPLWTDAYLGDTTHLTTIEHGAYLLLLITAWRTSECRLTDDDRLLARYTRLSPAQWKRMRPILAEFFDVSGGFWNQRRLNDEREAVKRHRESQSNKGRAGAAAKALKNKGRHQAGAKSGLSPAKAQVQPDASSHTHIEKGKDKSLPKKLLSDDWKPEPFGEGTEAAAIIAGWPDGEEARQLERFRDHHRARGNRFSDWQSGWGTWVRNSVTFARAMPPRRDANNPNDASALVDQILAERDHKLKTAVGGRK